MPIFLSVLAGEQISRDYGHDELGGIDRMPDVLVRAHTTEEIAEIMKYAYANTIPVTVRSGGTGLVGAAVPVEGGKVAKNSTGYSLKDLIIGSEGTLAIITEAVLKLVPLPKFSVSLLVPFADMKSAIEYMSRDTILFSESYLGKKFPDSKNDAYILLTFDGNTEAQIESDMQWKMVLQYCFDAGNQAGV